MLKKIKIQTRNKNRDYTAVLLEEIRDDFKIFGEELTHVRKKGDTTSEAVEKLTGELVHVRQKGDATFEAVGEIKEDVTILKGDVTTLKMDMKEVKKDVAMLKGDTTVLKKDMIEVKEELHIIRNELKEKVGRDEFKLLENRVLHLEREAHSRR